SRPVTQDLILSVKDPFVLKPEGADVFWNLVLPAGVADTRWVRAMEILPGNRRVVHKANVLLYVRGIGRARDREFPVSGFPGVDSEIASIRFEPDSHFLFWKPGT